MIDIRRLFLFLIVLFFAANLRADWPPKWMATAPTTAPGAVAATEPAPVTPPLTPEQLQTLYQHELGDKYNPADFDHIYKAHQLIEQYFSTNSPEDHKALVKLLTKTGLDPNLLGRITRIHLDWPTIPGGAYHVNEMLGALSVQYFVGLPKNYDPTRSWPMVVMLPTADAFLTDPRPSTDKIVELYTTWIEDELRVHPDAVVLMPELDLNELWGPSYVGMNNAIGAINHAIQRFNIDPAQVYLLGNGMSAHATWNLALHYTTYFSAIAPLAGGASADWQIIRVINLRNVLPVIWHDADDPIVKVEEARKLVFLLKKFKYDYDYEETQNAGHGPPTQVLERVYAKMRARQRELYPPEVMIRSNRPDTMFNRVDWVQLYQPTTPGKDHRASLQYGSGRIATFEHLMGISAAITGPNRIEAQCDNVDTLRFYLNDQMVDFSKPVTIVVDKKVRFQGLLTPSIDEMLKDQVFLGRGWRYFTAVVDVDLVPPEERHPATAASSTQPIPRPTEEPGETN